MPRRQCTFPILLALLLPLLLGGCGNNPYAIGAPDDIKELANEDPRNEGKTARLYEWQPVTKVRAIAFCYGDLFNSAEEVREVAELRCKGGRVEPQGVDYHFRGCALLQSYRATFICLPGTAEDSPPTASD